MSPPAPFLSVSCVRCKRLHEPKQPLAFNPMCVGCALPKCATAPDPTR